MVARIHQTQQSMKEREREKEKESPANCKEEDHSPNDGGEEVEKKKIEVLGFYMVGTRKRS